MPTLRINLIYLLYIFLPLLLSGHPSFAEMIISEELLPADAIVEDLFQAGSGLPVGKIQAVRGEAIVYHRDPAVAYRVKTGLPLYPGDTIITRNAGRILCRLIDGTIFSLVPKTTLAILQCNHNSARKSSLSFLSLKRGGGHFQVSPPAGIFSHEVKIETVTAFAQARNADFIIKTTRDTTEIITFEYSRLEVTDLTEPEVTFFLTDFQRTVVADQSGPQIAETVSQEEAEAVMAETRVLPQSHLFASSAEKYSEEDTTAEAWEFDRNAEY